jgi:hypothetical protein
MVRRKARSLIMVADGGGGMTKLEDQRFEKGDWPIRFEIPAAGEQAERWSRYLKWGCHKRGWSPSSLGQVEREGNSGTITVTGDDFQIRYCLGTQTGRSLESESALSRGIVPIDRRRRAVLP